MTPELCAHYSSLAIDPEQNKDELEGIVRECAVQAGFLEQKMFRGHAREAGAAEEPFRKGAAPSFTDIPDIALVYAHRPETVCGFSIGRAKKTPHTQVREAYIKIERPLTMKNLMTPFGEVLDKLNIERGSKEARRLFEDVVKRDGKPEIFVKHSGWDSDFAWMSGHGRAADAYKIDSYAYADSRVFVAAALAAGFDGVIHKDTFKSGLRHLKSVNGKTEVPGLAKNATHMTWRPLLEENIKLADAITRDDAGNIIPLEKRFIGNDIRGGEKAVAVEAPSLGGRSAQEKHVTAVAAERSVVS